MDEVVACLTTSFSPKVGQIYSHGGQVLANLSVFLSLLRLRLELTSILRTDEVE